MKDRIAKIYFHENTSLYRLKDGHLEKVDKSGNGNGKQILTMQAMINLCFMRLVIRKDKNSVPCKGTEFF